MSNVISLRFESTLHASAEKVWEWITSIRGIRAEMWPFFFMTAPRGVRSLSDVQITPGKRMFRSYVFLFGMLPVDYSDMTLLELNIGQGLMEQSPMGSMNLWRHERQVFRAHLIQARWCWSTNSPFSPAWPGASSARSFPASSSIGTRFSGPSWRYPAGARGGEAAYRCVIWQAGEVVL